MSCLHNESNRASASISYLEDSGRYMLDLTVRCEKCGERFRFLGVPMGLNLNGVSVSPDGLELRCAIMPESRIPAPIEGIAGFNIGGVQP